MNRLLLRIGLFSLGACLGWSAPELRAQETVALQIPEGHAAKLCPTPVWRNLPVQWLGTEDRRSAAEVGVESKKGGKDAVSVLAQPPLDKLFDRALREIFERCGMSLDPGIVPPWTLRAVLEEFHAGVEKGLILGKGKAKSRLTLYAESRERKLNASVGYELEFKNTKKKSLQRLTETLNELLLKTLEQVPKSTQLRSMQP